MSLNQTQRAATRGELQANLGLSGLSASDIAHDLGLAGAHVRAALDVTAARPEDVWLVRDYLDRVIRSKGATPVEYSALTEGSRAAARTWFPLADLDDVLKKESR